MVIGISPDNEYVLYQAYETQNNEGRWVCVENYYYRDRGFIESYWADTIGLPCNGNVVP